MNFSEGLTEGYRFDKFYDEQRFLANCNPPPINNTSTENYNLILGVDVSYRHPYEFRYR